MALLSGCASNQPASAISKVQMFHLKTEKGVATRDQMILSESRSRFWGALTREERQGRLGNYYKVHWKAEDEATPVTVKFEYRQASSGSTLHTQTTTVPSPHGSNVTEFQVTGPAYQKDGRVVAWRVTVEQGGRVLGEESSFLWN